MRYLWIFTLGVASTWAGCKVDPQAWEAPGGCTEAYHEGERWHNDCYSPIRAATRTEEGLRNRDQWIMERVSGMPFYLPFEDPDTRVISGWVGDKQGHYGVDYSRTDGQPINVRAAAHGWVVWEGKDDAAGHAVIIDHDNSLRSIYHMQAGGTDVRQGEWVDAGQQIGRATPYLHFAVAAPATRVDRISARYGEVPVEERWTLFDPYGLYAGPRSLACYNNDDAERTGLQHPSIFAPITPDFIDADVKTFTDAYNYYTRFKWHPWTLSLAVKAGAWTVSGSFHSETELPPSVTLFRSFDDIETDITSHAQNGFQPGQISAAVDASGDVRFGALFWTARPFITHQRLSPEDFLEQFQQQIKDERVLTQYLPQVREGQLLITATWTKLEPFRDQAAFYGLTEQEFQAKDQELVAMDFDLVDVLRYKDAEHAQRIAGLWHKHVETSNFRHSIGVDAGAFDEAVTRAQHAGYGLWRVHRHAAGVDLVFLEGLTTTRPEQPTDTSMHFDPQSLTTQKHPEPSSISTGPHVTAPKLGKILIEGAWLVENAYFSEGSAIPADMTPFFASKWSDDAALLWAEAGVGARATLPIEVPRDGLYAVLVRYTQGGNFGIFRHELSGRPFGSDIDAYGEKVQPSGLVALGAAALKRGRNDLILEIRGKNPSATDTVVGIDHYELIPLD